MLLRCAKFNGVAISKMKLPRLHSMAQHIDHSKIP
jgi:hypothetical protein